MEVFWNTNQAQSITIGLDIAGYLLAGCLWLLIYSSWRNRRAAEPAPATESAVLPERQAAEAPREGRRRLEFVAFDRRSDTPEKMVAPDRRGRNRAEVFAVARTMLAEGATTEAVKSELPISDGELALLDAKKVD